MSSIRLAATTALLVVGGSLCGAAQVIVEDFKDGVIEGNPIQSALIRDLGDGRGSLLSLTQGLGNQIGCAWFSAPFNLRDNKVTIGFDLWIRPGTTDPPADGMSVIFQFGNDLSALGVGGGGLGVGGFPTEYVAVSFDIYDNGPVDIETQCDNPVNPHTCHIEVNQNQDPTNTPPLMTNVEFGVDAPDFTVVGATLVPIHARIVFDSGFIQVFLQTASNLAPAFASETLVLQTALATFPDPADAIIGFAASTGGADAHHEIDDLTVETGVATPRASVTVKLGNGQRGAINCGSSLAVTGAVAGESYTFVADSRYHGFLGTRTDVFPNEDQFADYGCLYEGVPGGPVDPGIAGVGDPALEPMYRTERSNNGALGYTFGVANGRFEVNLHFAEICPECGVSPTGDATRYVHARIEGEEALAHWSSALAAGNEAGTGPAARTAVVRTFTVDVDDGYLDVLISDVGLLGTPPSDAQINGISYRRIGNLSGGALSGDLEYLGPVQLPNLTEEVIVEAHFDSAGDVLGGCPEGWTCNSNGIYAPQIVNSSEYHGVALDSQRLRLTNNAGSVAATAIYNEPVDLSVHGFEAEFTVYLTRDMVNPSPPADGLTFFFLPGGVAALNALGAGGGSLAYAGIGASVGLPEGGGAVEIDTWQGGSDPNGFNVSSSGHVGLIVNGDVTQHIQTNITMDPATVAPAWPISLVQGGAEAGQFAIGTSVLENLGEAGLRVKVSLNNNRVRVWVATVNENAANGLVYPETKVIDTLIDYGMAGSTQGYFGFSAATGGAVTWHEVDDVKIKVTLNRDVVIERLPLATDFYSDSTTPIPVALQYVVVPGTGSHSVVVSEAIPPGWTARNVSNQGGVTGGVLRWSLGNVSAGGTLTYELVPADTTKADVTYTGSYAIDGRNPIPIPGRVSLVYVPKPCVRGSPASKVIDENFDGVNGCPPGFACNSNNDLVFVPGGVQEGSLHDGRLRLAPEGVTGVAGSAVWNAPIELTGKVLVAEFDVYFSDTEGEIDPVPEAPADGLTFMILENVGLDTATALGFSGGGLGYLEIQTGTLLEPRSLAVEMDTWQGNGDPSGYNTLGYGHMAVIRDGQVATHVQTNVDLDPTLKPVADIADPPGEGWPYFVDQQGAGWPLHVEVEYNKGHVRAWLTAPETYALNGVTMEAPFPRTMVLDAAVTFPGASGPGQDPLLLSVYVGFSAATGGAHCAHEIDNLKMTTYPCTTVGLPVFKRGDANRDGGINIADAVYILQNLFAQGPAIGCRDAADANDDEGVNIADAVYVLQNLFAQGPAIPAPGRVACGSDPTPHPTGGPDLGCLNYCPEACQVPPVACKPVK